MNNDGTDRLGFLIHDAARLLRKRFEARGAYGLSAAQWRLLVRVAKDDGIAQARLAELLEIEPISVSRLIDRMVEGGWVERRHDQADRRVRMVHATQKSRDAFGEVRIMAGELYEQALAGLSGDERRALVHGLMTMVANLADSEVGCAPAGDAGNSASNSKMPEGMDR